MNLKEFADLDPQTTYSFAVQVPTLSDNELPLGNPRELRSVVRHSLMEWKVLGSNPRGRTQKGILLHTKKSWDNSQDFYIIRCLFWSQNQLFHQPVFLLFVRERLTFQMILR